jgi:EAL domain-containing protein (putative c-di-GMP-specific phosphodiesterase class I)
MADLPRVGVTDGRRDRLALNTRERLGRALETSLGTGAAFAVAVVGLGIVAAWCGTYLAGGSRSVLPHAFYLPIIFAAHRFRWPGALVGAIAAGVAVGPFMPLDVSAGTTQSPSAWAARLVAFLTIGLLVAWLSGESRPSIITFARDARGARRLRQGLDRGEFAAHYQPVFDLSTGDVAGFEALCRWQDPVVGNVSPADFIPLAERTGDVVAIGVFMLQQATHQAASWGRLDLSQTFMAVNVSAVQLCHPDFFAQVSAALRDSGLAPPRLFVEITETDIIRDRRTALSHIAALHDLGVLVALDDFGTGHASLAYLQDFPIDVVKIDISFVATVDSDPKSAALVAGIIQLARALGAVTVGEGIERHTQLEALHALGCDYGQGYYLARPRAARPFEAAARSED